MSPTEIAALATAAVLLLSNAAALQMWRRTRKERDTAIVSVETVVDGTQRTIRAIGDELSTVTAERDAARSRAALAETRHRIAQEGWDRAVDKLRTPAPLTVSAPQMDRESLEALVAQHGRRQQLWAVPRG